MTQKHTSATDASTAINVVLVTLDNHVNGAIERAEKRLICDLPGVNFKSFAATEWEADTSALQSCKDAIASGDIIIVTMLFIEGHIKSISDALAARRDDCDAMVCCMSAPEIMQFTRMGRFTMDGEPSGPVALLKRLRGAPKDGKPGASGERQLAMLRRLPRILRFIPGTAQDVRAYFLTLQYWLAGSEDNLTRLVSFLIHRYAGGPREVLRKVAREEPPIEYPDVGVYHVDGRLRISDAIAPLEHNAANEGTVGLLLMRSYALAGNTRHYDAVIRALEARGLRVIPAFASGLDARPAVKRFFMSEGESIVDTVISLTGFSLVGGPAYNDTDAAQEMLAELNVPYLAVQALEFQSINQWRESPMGLMPVEATIMVAIPELDGATGPMVFSGRDRDDPKRSFDMSPETERIERLASRVSKLVALHRKQRSEKKIAITLFNFPPNSGAMGTAAHLSVFESLFNSLKALSRAGYKVDLPDSVESLRDALLKGNAELYGAEANVHATISVDDHVAREPYLEEIEAQWGPAPGKHWTDGRRMFVLGQSFGNVFVGVQPAMGYEGDPMRLLFEGGLAPTHVFSAYYRWLREDYAADAVLHFGTHGALEFMPGKQVGLSNRCWPDRLIADLPNFYLYAANNPSEGLIAKRRSAATLISYLTPPVTKADLHKEFAELRSMIDLWRGREPDATDAHLKQLLEAISAQAERCELTDHSLPNSHVDADPWVSQLRAQLDEIEQSLIPFGMHVIGGSLLSSERAETIAAIAEAGGALGIEPARLDDYLHAKDMGAVKGLLAKHHVPSDDIDDLAQRLMTVLDNLETEHELPALISALDGQFIPPVSGGDLIRNPESLPTGRNIHGFDPFRLPSAFAVLEGRRQAEQLTQRHFEDTGQMPTSIALVLWGTDNLKSEGIAIGQALALIGAKPRFDSYGRLCGAELIDLDELGRPRVDVIVTLSGIFRDLLPMQTRLLAEAAYLAAEADEPLELNPIRRNALAYQEANACDLETAALRVFSNSEGAYGSNVNLLVDSGRWDDESQFADTYTNRKGFAYGRSGTVSQQTELLNDVLGNVDLAYQNLDSVELGITTVDHYFDTLGGISSAVQRVKGDAVPVYIADHTGGGDGKVRTLDEQVALETRTRLLNPKWYESMLDHGYEGVRQIEAHLTNTMGWSATAGGVAPWVYKQVSETFILDEDMRRRLAELNPVAASRVANRLIEAQERDYWGADEEQLEALRRAGEDLEDLLEGITGEVAA